MISTESRPVTSATPSPATTPRVWRMAKVVAAVCGVILLFALAACGRYEVLPNTTPTSVVGATATATPTRFAYLYSRIDYPLQVAVDAGDTVTLTLSPHSDILTVTPAPGQGTGTVGTPIPLPTDLQNYQDVAASVDTQSPDNGAFTWALVSPARQSLLTDVAAPARTYRDSVIFQWRVTAVSAGQNTARIVLHLIYVYLDGSEHDGTIEVSQSPVPMLAVQTSAVSIALSQARLPLVGVSGFAGILALLRYIYNALKTVSDVTGQVKGAVKVAQTVRQKVDGSDRPNSASSRPTPGGSGSFTPTAAYPPPQRKFGPPQPTAHPDDVTWPARRGSAPEQWPSRQWPPLPSGPQDS